MKSIDNDEIYNYQQTESQTVQRRKFLKVKRRMPLRNTTQTEDESLSPTNQPFSANEAEEILSHGALSRQEGDFSPIRDDILRHLNGGVVTRSQKKRRKLKRKCKETTMQNFYVDSVDLYAQKKRKL